jgi:hypothetical protein
MIVTSRGAQVCMADVQVQLELSLVLVPFEAVAGVRTERQNAPSTGQPGDGTGAPRIASTLTSTSNLRLRNQTTTSWLSSCTRTQTYTAA